MESLPLGFRFRPTDVELIDHYLRLKINGRHSEVQVIPEVDVCKWEPWDLPRLSVIKTDDPEWFFFCPRDRKYPNGHRSNRATDAGYWKATGKDRTIKSRKSSPSGQSNPQLIGMKKTLVFYRGRAPKGERTNWIMHEYRATETDLDGTAPDQAAYVLCRLFHKPDEKTDNSKDDEAEHTGSSPTTVRSSPDDTSSDLFQEQPILDMEVGKQPEGITRWLTDKSDEMTSNSHAHVESCMSDAEDHSTGAAGTEVYPLLGGDPTSQGPMHIHDQKVFSASCSNCNTDKACADSPFADDFGSNHNGLHFQDGTSEQDVSLTELLDNLQKHEEYPCEESRSSKFSDIGSKSIVSGNSYPLHQGPEKSENLRVSGLFTENGGSMFRGQVCGSPQSLQAQVSNYDAEGSMSNLCSLHDQYAENNMSLAYSVMQSLYNPEQSFDHINPASHGSNVDVRSGIRIHQRQRQNHASPENLSTQGTAARRIRLQMDNTQACCDASSSSDGMQEESVIIEASEDSWNGSEVGRTISDHRKIVEEEGKTGVGLRNRNRKEDIGKGMRSMFSWRRTTHGVWGRIYAISLYIVVALSVIFVRISQCPSFRALDN